MKQAYNPEKHHRRSIRLKEYDYSQEGTYFITVSAHNKQHLFGVIAGDSFYPNKYGNIVTDEWLETENIRKNVKLDVFIVMPNHFHGIIIITDSAASQNRRGILQYAPTRFRSPSQTIGAIVRGFKSSATKRINILQGKTNAPFWQRNYYEHIIRNEEGLNRIREYIKNNPMQWRFDRENPHHIVDAGYSDKWDDLEKMIYGRRKRSLRNHCLNVKVHHHFI